MRNMPYLLLRYPETLFKFDLWRGQRSAHTTMPTAKWSMYWSRYWTPICSNSKKSL